MKLNSMTEMMVNKVLILCFLKISRFIMKLNSTTEMMVNKVFILCFLKLSSLKKKRESCKYFIWGWNSVRPKCQAQYWHVFVRDQWKWWETSKICDHQWGLCITWNWNINVIWTVTVAWNNQRRVHVWRLGVMHHGWNSPALLGSLYWDSSVALWAAMHVERVFQPAPLRSSWTGPGLSPPAGRAGGTAVWDHWIWRDLLSTKQVSMTIIVILSGSNAPNHKLLFLKALKPILLLIIGLGVLTVTLTLKINTIAQLEHHWMLLDPSDHTSKNRNKRRNVIS